jgi:hypothetical protein
MRSKGMSFSDNENEDLPMRANTLGHSMMEINSSAKRAGRQLAILTHVPL